MSAPSSPTAVAGETPGPAAAAVPEPTAVPGPEVAATEADAAQQAPAVPTTPATSQLYFAIMDGKVFFFFFFFLDSHYPILRKFHTVPSLRSSHSPFLLTNDRLKRSKRSWRKGRNFRCRVVRARCHSTSRRRDSTIT